jgi:hypothetical protein
MHAMQRRTPHLSRPLYEGLPWLYIICGLMLLAGSYLLAAHGVMSLAVGMLGLAALVGGFAVLLRRRDYRALRARYADPDSLSGGDKRR